MKETLLTSLSCNYFLVFKSRRIVKVTVFALLAFSCILFLTPDATAASNFYSKASANWNVTTTWSTVACGGATAAGTPTVNDSVIVCNGNTVTVTANATIVNLTVNTGGILSINSGVTLTISGKLICNGTIQDGTGAGTLTMSATSANIDGSGNINNTTVNLSSATGQSRTVLGTANLGFGATTVVSFSNPSTSASSFTINTGGTLTFNNTASNAATFTNSFSNLLTFTNNGTINTAGTLSFINTATGTFTWLNDTTGIITSTSGSSSTISINGSTGSSSTACTATNNGIINETGGGSMAIQIAGASVSSGTFPFTNNAIIICHTLVCTSPSSTNTMTFTNADSVTASSSITLASLNSGGKMTLTNSGGKFITTPTIAINPGGGSSNCLFDNFGTVNVTGSAGITVGGSVAAAAWTNETVSTLNIAGAMMTAGGTLTATGINSITYNGTVPQTIKATTYDNLLINNSSTATLGGATTVTGGLTVIGTLSDGGFQLTGNATYTFLVAANSTYKTTRTASPWFPTAFTTAHTTLGVNSTFEYAGNGSFTIPTSPVTTYVNLTISTGGTKTLGATTTINNNLTVSAGTFADGAFLITGPGSGSGTFTLSGTASLTLANTSVNPFPAFQSYNFTSTSTVNFTAIASTNIPAIVFGNLSLSAAGAATKTAQGGVSVTGNFSIGANVTFNDGGFSIEAVRDVTNNGSHTGTGKIYLDGGIVTHNLSGTGAYSKLELNDATGAVLNANTTVNGTLTLTNGTISTGANKIILPAAGIVSRTSGWVNGNLQLGFDAGHAIRTFAIGDASNYTAIDVTFNSLNTGGDVTAATVAGANPNENTPTTNASGINQSRKVNRYWTMTNSGVGFTSYDATFHFVGGDVLGGAFTSNFLVSKFSSGSWSSLTGGTKTSTSSQATGITSFSDFEIGEQSCSLYTIPAPVSNSPLCVGSTLNLSSTSGASYSWTGPNSFTSTQQNPAKSNVVIADSGIYTVTVTNASGCTASATALVNINSLPTPSASSNSPICAGSTLNLTSGGGTGYSWTGPNGFTSSLQNPNITNVTAANAGTYSVTVATGGNSWSQKTGFGGTGRYSAVSFSIGSKGYIGTGNDGSAKKDFWEYDPDNNTWTQKADFGGTARSGAVGFSVGSKGYIGTGNDGGAKKDFWEYDPGANTWTQKTDFAGTARQRAVGFGIGSKGYIGTGNDGGRTQDFWEYDPGANTWTQKAGFGGTGRQYAVGFSIGAKGYIGTGEDVSGETQDFWEYNPGTNTWVQKADFGGGARQRAAGFNIGTKGYIGTGYTNSTRYKDFWEYDAGANAWTQKANFGGVVREQVTGFSIGAKGYIGTGYTGSNLQDFWEYDQIGCTAMATTAVTINALPTASASSNSPVLPGGTLNLTSGGGGTYAWSGPASFTSSQQNPLINNAAAINGGTYTVTVTVGGGCTSSATTSVIILGTLSGTYTVGGSSPNFANLTVAINNLNSRGVSGPVIFSMRAGTFTTGQTINAVSGSSATNTVTFQPVNSTSNVILSFGQTGITLANAKYIRFNKLAFNTTLPSTSASNAIVCTGNCSGLQITSCIFNNVWYPVNLNNEGSFSSTDAAVVISDNTMGSAATGIYGANYQSIKILRNGISLNLSSSYSANAVSLSNVSSFNIEKNQISTANSGFANGIYLANCNGSSSSHNTIINNFIEAGGSAQSAGISLQHITNLNIYHNTVNIINSDAGSSAINAYYAGGMISKNNIFVNSGNGFAISFNIVDFSTSTEDYNDYAVTGSNIGRWNGSPKTDLAAWQGATKQDVHSVSIFPSFRSNTDLHLSFAVGLNAGIPAGVTDDIDGALRNTPPYLGADEFSFTVTQGNNCNGTCLCGTYTIGGDVSATNYLTLSAAVTAINSKGIDPGCNVTFYIYGTQTGGQTVTAALESNNSLTFRSASGNANDATITNGLTFNNVNHIIFSNLTFSNASLNGLSLTAAGNINALVDSCIFNTSGGKALLVHSGTSSNGWQVTNSTFNISGSGTSGLNIDSNCTGLKAVKCIFNASGSNTSGIRTIGNSSGVQVTNCTFNNASGSNVSGINTNGNCSGMLVTSCTFSAGGSTAGCINMNGNCSGMLVSSCVFNASSSDATGINSNGNCSGLQATDCVFSNIYSPVFLAGNAYTQNDADVIIKNNTISGAVNAITAGSYQSIKILRNQVSGTGLIYGISLAGIPSFHLETNKISFANSIPSGAVTGIYINNCQGSSSSRNAVINNFISMAGSGGTDSLFGILLQNATYTDVYHNAVNIIATNVNNASYLAIGVDRVNNKNNIFVNTGGGYSVKDDGSGSNNSYDYNDYYVTGSNLGNYGGANALNLAAWIANTGEANSLSTDPLFTSATDLHVSASALDYAGTPVGVAYDIDGEDRDDATPDIGADEFSVCHLVASVITTSSICYGSNGNAEADPAGGTAPYTYLWGDGQTNQTAIDLEPGPVSVTITDAVGCMATASGIVAASSNWHPLTTIGGAGGNYILSFAFSLKGKGYYGLVDNSNGDFYNNYQLIGTPLWEYDPSNDTWTLRDSFPGYRRTNPAAFSIENTSNGPKGYVVTGFTGGYTNEVWEYTPPDGNGGGDSWHQLSNFPGVARYVASGFSIAGSVNRGYVAGGFGGNNMQDVWEYNPDNDQWIRKDDWPGRGSWYATSFSIGNMGYMGMGYNSSTQLYNKDFFELDPTRSSGDQWHRMKDFSGGTRGGASGFSISGKGYVTLGSSAQQPYRKDTWEFDPAADVRGTWTQMQQYEGRRSNGNPGGGLAIGNNGYIYNADGGNGINEFWKFSAGNQSTAAGGDWDNVCTWTANVVPYETQLAHVSTTDGNVVTVTSNTTAGAVAVDPGAAVHVSNNNTLSIHGNLTLEGTIKGEGPVSFNGASEQLIYGKESSMSHVTIDNANGVTLIPTDTITGSLTFVNGNINTGPGNSLVISPHTVPVIVTPPAGPGLAAPLVAPDLVNVYSGWVNGTLVKTGLMPSSGLTSLTFEVGDANTYAPVRIDLYQISGTTNNAPTGGAFSASTTHGNYPALANSPMDQSRSVARSWTVSNSNTVFDHFDLTLYYSSNEVPPAANPQNFCIAQTENHGQSWAIYYQGILFGSDNISDFSKIQHLAYNSDFVVGQVDCNNPKVVPAITTSVTDVSTGCTGGGKILLSTNGGYGPFSYRWHNANWSTDSTGQNITNLSAGTYTVTVTAVGVCTKTATVTVNHPAPAAASNGSAGICAGSTLNLTATGGSSYSWTFPNGTTSQLQNPSIENVDPTVVGTYSVTINKGCGAGTVTLTTKVTAVKPAPTISATPPDTTFCSGGKTNIRLASNLTGTTWSVTSSVISGTINGAATGSATPVAQTLTNTGTTQALVAYAITGTKTGCRSTINATVHINPKPTGTAAPSPVVLCSASHTGITLTPGAVNGTTFTWTAVPAATISGATVSCQSNCGTSINDLLSNTGTANGTVTYSVTPWANGCAGSTFKDVVTIRPVPVAIVNAYNNPICNGATTNIKLTSPTSLTTFAWPTPSVVNPVGGLVTGGLLGKVASISQKLLNNGRSQGVVTYTITPTYAGCPGVPIQVPVTVNPVANGTVSAASETINPGTRMNVTLNQGTITGTTTAFTWTYAPAATITGPPSSCQDHFGACGNSITDSLYNIGTASAKITYTILPWVYGCSGTKMTHVVTVRPKPVATNQSNYIICGGAKTNIKPTSTTTGTTWSYTASLYSGSITGFRDSTSSTIAQTLVNSGTTKGRVVYRITPSFQGSPGDAIYDTVTVNPVPTGIATPSPAGVCSGTTGNITLTPTGGVAGTHFSWTASAVSSISGAAPCTDTTGACGTSIPVHLTTSATTGPVEVYTITPWANGCAGTKFIENVTVQSGIPAKPTITGQTTGICASPVTYIYIVTNLAAFNTVTWQLPAGCTHNGYTLNSNPIVITYPSGYHADSVKAWAKNLCNTLSPMGFLKTSPAGSPCRTAESASDAPGGTDMVAYPNPAHDKLNVIFESNNSNEYIIRMIDITGRRVHERKGTTTEGFNYIEMDLGGLANGIYVLSFSSGEESKQLRIVVE